MSTERIQPKKSQLLWVTVLVASLLGGCVNMRCGFNCEDVPVPKKQAKYGPRVKTFTPSGPIVAHTGEEISGLHITSTSGPCITTSNTTNVKIHDNIIGPCGSSDDTDTLGYGIQGYLSDHVEINHNHFNDLSTGFYLLDSTGDINFHHNYATKVRGPFPRGQMIQLNDVNGPNIKVKCNVSDQPIGGNRLQNNSYGGPEDHISIYMSGGTVSSPLDVSYNKIRGGGSPTGGGIMTGDNGGSYTRAHHNNLVEIGNYGVAISGGSNMAIEWNKIFATYKSYTNATGTYVWDYHGLGTCSNATVLNNTVYFENSSFQIRWWTSFWNAGDCGTVNGDNTTNKFADATLTASDVWDEEFVECIDD